MQFLVQETINDVICEKEPERRKELDTYAYMIDSMFIQYGCSHFYDYHVAFARKAEQYFHLIETKLDWASRDYCILKKYAITLTLQQGVLSRI